MEETATGSENEQKKSAEDNGITPVTDPPAETGNQTGDDQNDQSDDDQTGDDQSGDDQTGSDQSGKANEPIPANEDAEQGGDEDEDKQADDTVVNTMETAEHIKVLETLIVTADGKTTYESLSGAKIHYEENCVEDGLVKANGTKIAFTIEPDAGKKVTAVKYFTAESEDKFTGSGSNATASGSVGALDTVYTIGTNISTLEKNQRVVRIAVELVPVQYAISFTDSASGATAWKKDTTGAYDFTVAGTEITGGATVNYGESLTFAVKGTVNKAATANVTATTGGDALKLDGKDGKTAAEDDYVEFTLDPLNVAGITSYADDAVTVTLANEAAINITAAATGGSPVTVSIDGNVTVSAPTLKDTYAKYEKLVLDGTTTTYHNDEKVYFAAEVKDEDQYKLVPPTAYFVKTGDDASDETKRQALTVVPETLQDPDGDAVAAYVISLADIKTSGQLFVTIGADLDDTKEAVKTVSFAANANAKAVVKDQTVNADNNILGKSKTTVADFYEFDVQADTGYEVTAVEVETAKIYADKSTATVTETISLTGEKLAENSDLYPFDGKQSFKVLFDGEDEADAEAGTPAKAWTARSVKVTVKTATATLAADAEVRFISNGNYGTGTSKPKGAYEFTVKEEENKVSYNKDTKTATVKAGAEYLEFTVTGAETEPDVKIHGQALAESVEGDGYTYRIPAASLNPVDNVFIGRKAKTVKVNYNDSTTVGLTVTDERESWTTAESAGVAPSGYDTQKVYTVNVDAEVNIHGAIASGKSTISAVSYLIGDQTTPTPAALNADGSFDLKVKATDDVTVFVDKSTDTKLEVSSAYEDGVILPGDDGVYEVSYADTVTAQILDGSGTAIALVNANVKDGEKNAETKATINRGTKTATLVFDKKEYNKDLKVTLTALTGETRITKEFTVRTETTVDGVKYTSDKIKDGALTLDMDTEVKTGVIMETGNSKLSNLEVAIVSETADKATGANVASAGTGVNGITAVLNDEGELVITAAPCASNNGKGKEKAARIVLVDGKDPEKKVIAGSSIMVSTADASILEKQPTVTTAATAKQIAVNITAPEGIVGNDQLILGKIGYKVEISKPATTGLDSDTKAALDKQFGLGVEGVVGSGSKLTTYLFAEPGKTVGREIQVMADEIGTAPNTKSFKGAEVKGFNVTVTLIQTRVDTDDEADFAAESASTIAGGKSESTVDTMKPVYSNTEKGGLTVKKGTTTLITGDLRDIVVATPNFGSGASYTYVWTQFVDTKTGIEQGTNGNYRGMTAWYDFTTNAVKVHFDNQIDWYGKNVDTADYKDLGVKVIAATEPEGHAISAVVPIKVVNGIEDIKATAQPFIKFEGKKTTAKVNVELNNTITLNNKKYAPQKKTVTYEIVGGTTTSLADITPGPAGVTVKNGTITVDKNFVLNKTAAKNQFKVLVRAADWAGNPQYDLTETIEISGQSRPMGAALIMKQGENGWTDAKIAASAEKAKLEVTQESDEYRLVVLKPEIAANKTSYDLTDTSIYVGYDELNITPAKGNIYVGENGFIIVKKLGKASFTITDKSDKKNKNAGLKSIEFATTSQNLVLRFRQLADSTPLTEVGTETSEQSINYTGRATTLFGVDVCMKDADGVYHEVEISNAKVSFKKNVKNVTPKKADEWFKYTGDRAAAYDYLIAVNGNPAGVVLSRKGQSNVEYTLTNSNVVSKKAPKLENVNKKQKIGVGSAPTVTYKVSASGVPSFEGSHVMLSLDTTKKNPDGAASAFNVNGVKYLDRALAIRDGSVFDFKIKTSVAGKYYLNAAVGTLAGGVFTQEYADAKITVNVLKAGKVKLKVDGKYGLDSQVASKLPIKYNSNEALACFVNREGASNTNFNYAKNAIIDNQENHFRDYFEAKEDADGYIATIGIRDDLNAEKLAEAINVLKTKNHKDQIGYITVTNGSMQTDVKIVLTYKSLEKSLTGKATTGVIRGTNMSVDIKLYNGKDYVAVDSYDLVVPDGFTKPKTGFLTVDADKGISDIHLTGNNVADGTRKVTLKVKLKTQHTKSDTTVNVTVPIKVEKETMKNKVVLTKDAKVWTFTHNDFAGPTGAANTPEQGSWKKDVNYTFKSLLSAPEDTEIMVASDTDYITFKSDAYKTANKNQVLSVEIDKAKLMAALSKKVNWNKKVTVKATFTYKGTALKEDVVKITLTLPVEPKAAVAEADFKAAEPSIQNLIDVLDKHNRANAPADTPANATILAQYKAASTAEITAKVKEKVNGVAGSANVLVTVTPNTTSDYAAIYTVTVTDPKAPGKPIYTNVFTVTTEKTAANVIASIDSLKLNNWSAVKIDDDVKNLLVLTKDTTDAQYAKMIRDVLKKKGMITENIGITVKTAQDGRKAPTTTEGGFYNVIVTATDKNVAPSVTAQYQKITTVNYIFNRMETVTEAKSTVTTALTTEATVKKIVDDAWKAVAKPGSKTTDETCYAELCVAVQKNILDTANKTLAAGASDGSKSGNSNVKAASIEEGSFTMSVNASGQLTAMSYTLLVSDTTAGAEKSELAWTITLTGKTWAIESMQTVTDFYTAISNLKSTDLTIKYVDTAEKAEEAIKAKILKDVSKNPAFDPDDLTVKAADDSFVAPSGSKNGAIGVNIKVTGQAAAGKDIANIIILANGKDVVITEPTTGTATEKLAVTTYAIAESRVKAAMNKEALIKAINAKIEAEKGNGAIDADDVKTVLESLASTALGSDTYELNGSAGTNITAVTPNTATDFVPPADSDTSWEIPAFKVSIKAKSAEGSPTVPADKSGVITVPAVRLGKMSKLQSLDQAKTAVTKAVKNGLDIGSITLEEESDFVNEGFKTASVTALNNAVKAEILAKNVITNPLITVTAAADTDPAAKYAKGTTTEDYEYKMENWKLTLAVTGDSETATVAVGKLNVLKDTKTPKVTGITFDNIGITDVPTVAGDHDGTADNKRLVIPVEGETTQFGIGYTVAVTDPAANIEGIKDVDMAVIKHGESDASGRQGVKVAKDENGEWYLDVPLTATGDTSKELPIDLTVTAKNSQPGQAAKTKKVFLTLKFKPTIKSFDIVGPAIIELANDGTNATNSTGAKYKAVVDGYHLTAAEKKAAWTGTIATSAGANGAYTPADTSTTAVEEVTVKFVSAVPDAKIGADKKYTVIATLDIDEDIAVDGNKTASINVTLSKNKAVSDTDAAKIELKTDESVAKLEEVTVPGDTTINRLTVTGKDVSIPLSVIGGEDRDWIYTIADVASGNLITTYGNDGTPANNAIRIDQVGKNAKLIITNAVKATDTPDVTTDADGNVTNDITKKIKITATSAASADTGKDQIVSELTLALVVKQNVTGMKLQRKNADDTVVGTGNTAGDTGIGTINAEAGDEICLQPVFEGAHVDQADAVDPAKIKYRLRQNPFGSDETTGVVLTPITAENRKKAAKIAIGSGVAANGTIVVEATYTSGGVTTKAARAIYVNAATVTGTMKMDNASTGNVTIAKTVDAAVTKTFSMTDLAAESSVPTWSVTTAAEARPYVTINKTTGVLTIDAVKATGIPAGSFLTTVRADWLDGSGALQSKEATFNIVVEAEASAIVITGISGNPTTLIEGTADPTAGTATLKNATAGTLTVTAKVTGDRKLSTALEKRLKYTVKNGSTTSAGLTTQVVGTATDVTNGTITVTIPAGGLTTANGTFEVEFSIKPVTDQLADNAVTKKVTVTVGAAPAGGGGGGSTG